MTDEPTDEALENLFVEETGFATDDFPAAIFDFARAVLAKWGQPAVAGEPVAWMSPGKERLEFSRQDTVYGSHTIPLYTTPQPTQPQAGAVPLTNEKIRAMLNKHPPEAVCDWSYRMGIDDAELHHGIKGGQHEPKQMD